MKCGCGGEISAYQNIDWALDDDGKFSHPNVENIAFCLKCGADVAPLLNFPIIEGPEDEK